MSEYTFYYEILKLPWYYALLFFYGLFIFAKFFILKKEYHLDIKKLHEQVSRRIGVRQVERGRLRGLGRSSAWDGVIENTKKDWEDKIKKRKLEYDHDLIRALFPDLLDRITKKLIF